MANCNIELSDEFIASFSTTKGSVVRFIKRNFKENRDFIVVPAQGIHAKQHGGQNKKTLVVTEEVYEILPACYNLRNNVAIDQIRDSKITRILMSVENSTISFICKALRHLPLTMLPQYHVGPYKVDMYIPELDLCVECDEFDHRGYNELAEEQREQEIADALSCKFLRFNPQSEGFDVADVLAEILRLYRQKADDNHLKVHQHTPSSMDNNNTPSSHPKSKKVYKYSPHDLTHPIESFTSIKDAARSTSDPKIQTNHIMTAHQENTVCAGFRWFIPDGDSDNASLPTELDATKDNSDKPGRRYGVVAQINSEQTQILHVYQNQKHAAQAVDLTPSSITIALKSSNRSAGGFYWRMYEDCDANLQATFKGEVPQAKKSTTSARLVDRIDPKTHRVLQTFECIQDVLNVYRGSHKKITEASKSGEVYMGFIWRVRDKNKKTTRDSSDETPIDYEYLSVLKGLVGLESLTRDQRAASISCP